MNDVKGTERKTLFKWVGWFSLINYILIAVFIARYLKYTNEVEGFLPFVYIFTALSGHASCLVLLPFLTMFLPCILIFPKPRALKSLGIAVATFGCIALLIDFGVYSQYRFHINGMVIDLIINGGSEIFDFSWATYLIGVIAIIAVFGAETGFSYVSWKLANRPPQIKIRRILIVFAALSLISSNVIHAWADAAYYRPITAVTRHIPLFKPITAKRFMEKHGFVNLDENWKLNRLSAKKIKNHSINYPAAELDFKPSLKPLNLVYIVIDSWRFDMLGGETTPNIANFISERPILNFENHTSSGNGTRTGIFGLFYGLFGSYWNSMETNQIGPVFIKELLDNDYQMGIFASSKLTSPAFNQTVFSLVENLRLYSDGSNAWERDCDIADDWEQWFEKRDREKAFFSFLFFDSAHAYTFPPDYQRLFKPVLERVDYHKLNNDYDPLPYINRYKTSLHFIDSLIGKILSRIEQATILENTVIVITSDHGQEFNDNKKNYWGHGSNFTKYQINIPLVIYWPGKKQANYTHLTNHIDLAPTFLTELLGCTNPVSDYSNGRNLFDTRERQWIFSGGGLSAQAIVEQDRITETFNTGGYEIFAPDNSVIRGARLNPSIVKESILEKRRFYK